jgi:hypothetical protein
MPRTHSSHHVAAQHAAALIAPFELSFDTAGDPALCAAPAERWAACGAMWLTGHGSGPPRPVHGPLASCADGALTALRGLARTWDGPTDGAALLGERAAIAGLRRAGRISAGGSCRLIRAADGWLAANLARPDDLRLVPAWLEREPDEDAWVSLGRAAPLRARDEWIERARWLGLAVAPATAPAAAERTPVVIQALGEPLIHHSRSEPLVLDLSALWAGPLCGHLLKCAGARVVKVESWQRPDGARAGPPAFFDLLNAGKRSVALDLGAASGRAALRQLLDRADIVIESSRPRALAQLGIDAAGWVAEAPGRSWVSLTGYGRPEPYGNWVAFGDDAAVAAGLAWAVDAHEERPLFCGDAIADPLGGLHAAVAALGSWRAGGGHLLDVSLRDVCAHALAAGPADSVEVIPVDDGWEIVHEGRHTRVAPPRARRARETARVLGADTETVLAGC